MTYIIANTQREGKEWVQSGMLSSEEKYKVLSTPSQLRGRAFVSTDDVYILTCNPKLINVLLPALCGAQTFSHENWYDSEND